MRSGAARARIQSSSADARPLYTLLSGLLVAFALDVERATGLSLVLGANVLRVLDDVGVPVVRLSELTGIAGMGIENSLSALERGGQIAIQRDPAGGRARLARLTASGLLACAAHLDRVAAVEREWVRRAGKETVHAVREALELPLLAGLAPYPDGWRAQVPPPQTLPHFPFVSHRGGYPDGS
jgi:DNA-binding MarR family transcriptional regulator